MNANFRLWPLTYDLRHAEKLGAAMETVFAHRTQEETPVTEAVQSLDIESVLLQMNAKGREVGPTDFIRALITMFGYTYEFARDVVYGLIEVGRASLTDRFNLRFAE